MDLDISVLRRSFLHRLQWLRNMVLSAPLLDGITLSAEVISNFLFYVGCFLSPTHLSLSFTDLRWNPCSFISNFPPQILHGLKILIQLSKSLLFSVLSMPFPFWSVPPGPKSSGLKFEWQECSLWGTWWKVEWKLHDQSLFSYCISIRIRVSEENT